MGIYFLIFLWIRDMEGKVKGVMVTGRRLRVLNAFLVLLYQRVDLDKLVQSLR